MPPAAALSRQYCEVRFSLTWGLGLGFQKVSVTRSTCSVFAAESDRELTASLETRMSAQLHLRCGYENNLSNINSAEMLWGGRGRSEVRSRCMARRRGLLSSLRGPFVQSSPSSKAPPLLRFRFRSGLQIPLRAERSSSGRRGELREADTVLISLGREGSRRRDDCQLCKTRGQVFFMSWMPETSWDPRSGELEHLEALEPWKCRCIRVICVRFLWYKNLSSARRRN